MKNLKVKIDRHTSARKFEDLPQKEKDAQYSKRIKKMECPCCEKTMYLVDGVWRCYDCAYCIMQKDMLDGVIFWFCDECGRFMNVQPGFTDKTGVWKCVGCGFVNDVSADNIMD